MGNYAKETYNVGLWWDGVEAFSTVVNDINNAAYAEASWRTFAEWGRTTRTPEWKVNVRETNIPIAAAVLTVNGQKPPRGIGGWNNYNGTIPLIGHAFTINAADFLAMRGFEDVPGDPDFYSRFTYSERLAANIAGMHGRINMFVYQGLSTGYITADVQNNQEGIQSLIIDLGFKAENRIVPTIPWAQTGADPIQDMLDAQDKASDDGIPVTNWLLSKKLLRDLALNENVRLKVALKMFPNSPNPGDIPLTRREVMEGMQEYYDILPIIEIDEKAAVQEDGGSKYVRSFDETIAVLCDPVNFFELQNCRNVYADDQNPNVVKTTFENDHFTMIVEHFSNPYKITSSMEGFVLPVPRNPNNVILIKSDATGPWGSRAQMESVLTNGVKTVKNRRKVLVDGEEYTRLNVIGSLNTIGVTTANNISLAATQAVVDGLDETQLESLIADLNP